MDSGIRFSVPWALEISLKSLVLGLDRTAVSRLISGHTFRKKLFFPTIHYKYETLPCIFMLWTTTHNFPIKHVLQPGNQRNPKNIRALIHNQVKTVPSITMRWVRLHNCRTCHLSPYMLNLFGEMYYSLHSLYRAS